MSAGPFDLLRQVVAILDELKISYVLGGSLASSMVGEPRSTVDIDVAVRIEREQEAALLERFGLQFYVPSDTAAEAIRRRSSFNVVDPSGPMKVDFFVLGDGLLDRRQLARRVRVHLPGSSDEIWVTSPEDQVLRKLDWYRR